VRTASERARGVAALRESEAKFRTIADAMPQMVWSTLPDGFHDYYNQQWYDFTGAPAGTTDGEGWNGMFHPEDQPHAWELWRQSLATGATYEIEYRLRHRSGEYRWVLGRALPVRNEDGAIVRWMGTCTDIHEQKRAQEELMANNRRKDDFLAMLAHELRNPLAPISTASHLLRTAPSDAAHVARSADIISRQVRHMTELVDDLLDVSRVTRGLVELERAPVELKAVVGNAIEQVRPLIEARGHQLTTRMASGNVYVLGDRTRLVQVISNLLNNAAKYTPQNGALSLSMTVGEQIEVRVSDNGMGIEAQLLPQVFDLFTQGERTPDRSQGGLGLGLALVKSLVELHGGRVGVASDGRGQGSAFTVTLPLLAASPATAEPLHHPTEASPPSSSRRVMVVDDNKDAAETLGMLLESLGHAVRVAHDPGQALAAVGDDEVALRFARAGHRLGAQRLSVEGGRGGLADCHLPVAGVVPHLRVQRVEAAAGDRERRVAAVQPGLHQPPEVHQIRPSPAGLRPRAAGADRIHRLQRRGDHRPPERRRAARAVDLGNQHAVAHSDASNASISRSDRSNPPSRRVTKAYAYPRAPLANASQPPMPPIPHSPVASTCTPSPHATGRPSSRSSPVACGRAMSRAASGLTSRTPASSPPASRPA
jgi:PAS domain S-box-containing protein